MRSSEHGLRLIEFGTKTSSVTRMESRGIDLRIYEQIAYSDEPVARNYWATTTQQMKCPKLQDAIQCDSVIIGAGYTGLNAAIVLAEAGQDVVILDENQPGWGASGRNGGFCCLGGSKLSAKSMIRKFGMAAANDYARAEKQAVEHVESVLDRFSIDVDRVSNGETVLAHRPSDVENLKLEAAAFEKVHGTKAEFIPKDELQQNGLNGAEFFAALTAPIGFALNPMKYVQGLAVSAKKCGVQIFGTSPVEHLSTNFKGEHIVKTPQGEIAAKNLIVATNGYSSENIPGWLAHRYLPVQSNIILTRPLTSEELTEQGWTTHQMCYDTRNILHYFRLLPDKRFLFGTRGAVECSPKELQLMVERSKQDLVRMFPAWSQVEIEFDWSGLVNLTRSRTPYAGPVPDLENAWIAMGYHGNGVAMGSYCGKLIANQMLGKPTDTPLVMREPMRRFELGSCRRLLLSILYFWYGNVLDK